MKANTHSQQKMNEGGGWDGKGTTNTKTKFRRATELRYINKCFEKSTLEFLQNWILIRNKWNLLSIGNFSGYLESNAHRMKT